MTINSQYWSHSPTDGRWIAVLLVYLQINMHCRMNTLKKRRCADMDGALRLEDGAAGAAFEYGRLEIFVRGFWSNICDVEAFTPDSAQVACRALGYDGGSALKFRVPFQRSRIESEVRHAGSAQSDQA